MRQIKHDPRIENFETLPPFPIMSSAIRAVSITVRLPTRTRAPDADQWSQALS